MPFSFLVCDEESFIREYLSGNDEVPFQSVFLAFRDILSQPGCQLPRLPLRNAATGTPVFSDKNSPLPKSVSVVSRLVDVSKSRREGMVHVLWKLVGTGFCRNEREVEKLWKAKHPKEAGDRFLGVAVWAEQTEKEIFDKSQQDLSVYKSLLVNLVFGLVRKKDWGGKKMPENHLTNSDTQTEDSFLQQRQRSAEEILNPRRPKNMTKRDFKLLREQNRLLERKARRRRRLQLRHSFTQTSASLRDGLKSAESESSGAFSWLDLAPSPVRFFPMLWIATQTDDREINTTKKIVADGRIKLQMLPRKIEKLKLHHPMEPILDFLISWDGNVGVAPRKETALGLRMAQFVQLLLKTPNMVLGRCPNHQTGSGLEADCPFCTAAIKAPPPWADVMFRLLYELFTGNSLRTPTEAQHLDYLCRRQMDENQLFLGTKPAVSLLLHLLRQPLMDSANNINAQKLARKEFRSQSLSCGCFVYQMMEQLVLGSKFMMFGVGQRLPTILNKKLVARVHPSHMCLQCGKTESGGKFRVCSVCRRQGLLVKAHYCSVDCLLKDWHKHQELHSAFAPGKIPDVGSAVMMFSSLLETLTFDFNTVLI